MTIQGFRAARGGGLALLLGLAAATGCGRVQPKLTPPGPAEVEVSLPVVKEVTEYEDFTGRTEAVRAVEVRARVTGYLEAVFFKEGDDVQQGDRLFEIDPRTYRAELAKAEANVGQAEARVKRLQADYVRARELLPKKVVSREEFDKIDGDKAEAEASVKVARASRDVARLNLDFCTVSAPLGGRISRQLIDPGNLVKADETPLTSIVAVDPIYANFDVDERTMLRVRRLVQQGKVKSARETEVPVYLGLSDEAGFPHKGTINFVDNKVDPTTGTLRVRGVFPNGKRLISPGMFARSRIRIGLPYRAVLVSEAALGTDQGQKFVYVVGSNDKVEYRRVKVGSLHDGLRVVESGLSAGDRVVVSGLQRVRPGVTVRPEVREMPANGPGPAPPLVTNKGK
jgi:RND family efflux transporter MFP subunit